MATFLPGVGDHVVATVTQQLWHQRWGSRGASRTQGLGGGSGSPSWVIFCPRGLPVGYRDVRGHQGGEGPASARRRVPAVAPSPAWWPKPGGNRAGWGALCPLTPAHPEGRGSAPLCASVSPEALPWEGAPRTRSSPSFWGHEGSTRAGE